MARKDAGKYAAKHPQDTIMDKDIIRELDKIDSEKISCAAAHKIAENLGKKPAEVGVMIDLTERKITKCQLNLFGHGKSKPENKPMETFNSKIESDLRSSLNKNGRISCRSCWDTAEKHGVLKVEITKICETLGIKIIKCQLGAF